MTDLLGHRGPSHRYELVNVVTGHLANSANPRSELGRLPELEWAAVAEAVHSGEGRVSAGRFGAKYGATPTRSLGSGCSFSMGQGQISPDLCALLADLVEAPADAERRARRSGRLVARLPQDAVVGTDALLLPLLVALLNSRLRPGAHLITVGSRTELEPAIIARAHHFTEWRGAVTNRQPAVAAALAPLHPSHLPERGQLSERPRSARDSEDPLIDFWPTDPEGEDAAIAAALSPGAGSQADGAR